MADRSLTDLELERWLAEDLPEARRRTATAADRRRLDELRAEHAALLGTLDLGAELRAIDRRLAGAAPAPRRWSGWRWALSGGALAAVAVIVVLVALRPGRVPSIPGEDLHLKGDGVTLILHAASAAGSHRLAPGDTVRPGDRLRFEVGVPGRGYVAVVGIDGTGATTVHYPPGGHAPVAIDPRSDGVLPGAIELDAAPGDERFYAVYAERPFALGAALFAALRGEHGLDEVTTAEVVLNKKPSGSD
jgi:hypothetical protein